VRDRVGVRGHFLFTFSDTYAEGRNRNNAQHHRQMDRQTYGSTMPIADLNACSTVRLARLKTGSYQSK